MVTLRLARAGTKKRPVYHLVATDWRDRRDGRFIEKLGYFIPGRDLLVVNDESGRILARRWRFAVPTRPKRWIKQGQAGREGLAGQLGLLFMKNLIEYIAKALVDAPDAVEVSEFGDEEASIIKLKVQKEDLGKVMARRAAPPRPCAPCSARPRSRPRSGRPSRSSNRSPGR